MSTTLDARGNARPRAVAERLDKVRADYDPHGRFPYADHGLTRRGEGR